MFKKLFEKIDSSKKHLQTRKMKKSNDKIIVALADGCEEIEAITPIDVLRRAGFDVTTVGLVGRTITGSHGVVMVSDKEWGEVAKMTPDVLVLPGGMPGSKNLGEHAGLKEMANTIAENEGLLAALCAAPAFTLGHWGLLCGRNATCYPGCETEFPDDVNYKKENIVVDGNIITGCGPGVALEFSFAIVERLRGVNTAKALKAQMQYFG